MLMLAWQGRRLAAQRRRTGTTPARDPLILCPRAARSDASFAAAGDASAWRAWVPGGVGAAGGFSAGTGLAGELGGDTGGLGGPVAPYSCAPASGALPAKRPWPSMSAPGEVVAPPGSMAGGPGLRWKSPLEGDTNAGSALRSVDAQPPVVTTLSR